MAELLESAAIDTQTERWLALGDGAIALSRGCSSEQACTSPRIAASITGSRHTRSASWVSRHPRTGSRSCPTTAGARTRRSRLKGHRPDVRFAGRPTTEGSFSVDIRGLTYADLPRVIAIERRAFPTPWSLAMFVLELSKSSGVCLAALHDERLVGLSDLLALRHGVARHERRGRRRAPTQGRSLGSAWRAVRAGARRQRPLHTGGSPLQRHAIHL